MYTCTSVYRGSVHNNVLYRNSNDLYINLHLSSALTNHRLPFKLESLLSDWLRAVSVNWTRRGYANDVGWISDFKE